MTWAAWEPLYNVENGSSPSHTSYTTAGWGPNRSKPDKLPMSIFAFLRERALIHNLWNYEILAGKEWRAILSSYFYWKLVWWSYFSFLLVTTFFIQRGLKAWKLLFGWKFSFLLVPWGNIGSLVWHQCLRSQKCALAVINAAINAMPQTLTTC